MDIVYVLGSGSVWDDNEIRFSLRSVEKHLIGVGDVYIIGKKPNFLKNIIHRSVPDSYKEPWRNVYNKVRRACLELKLSEKFLLFNDDFYLLKDFKAATFPVYNKGLLRCLVSFCHNPLASSECNTLRLIREHCKIPLNYKVHFPFPIEKTKFLKMPLSVKEKGQISPRCFYGNFYKLKGYQVKDQLMLSPGQPFFSSTRGFEKDLKFREWLKDRFPIPSKWDKLIK